MRFCCGTWAKISSNLPNLGSLCLNWPFGVEIGLYLRQIASKIGQLNSLTNCLVFLVSLGQISLVNFYLVSKPRNFCSLFLVSHPSGVLIPLWQGCCCLIILLNENLLVFPFPLPIIMHSYGNTKVEQI